MKLARNVKKYKKSKRKWKCNENRFSLIQSKTMRFWRWRRRHLCAIQGKEDVKYKSVKISVKSELKVIGENLQQTRDSDLHSDSQCSSWEIYEQHKLIIFTRCCACTEKQALKWLQQWKWKLCSAVLCCTHSFVLVDGARGARGSTLNFKIFIFSFELWHQFTVQLSRLLGNLWDL